MREGDGMQGLEATTRMGSEIGVPRDPVMCTGGSLAVV